jgi:hypothetical protein
MSAAMLAAWGLALLVPQVDEKAAAEAVSQFRKNVANPNAAARAAAIHELARVPHERTFRTILPFLSADVKDVRKAAAKALAEYGDWKKAATPMLISALKSNAKEPEVQIEIYATLGKMADPLAVPTVHGGFEESDVRVAKAAIAASGAMRQRESIERLLTLQRDVQKWLKNNQAGPYRDDKGQQGDDNACRGRLNDVQKSIIEAFKAITLERWTSAQEWEIWWSRKRATFEVPPAPEKPEKK